MPLWPFKKRRSGATSKDTPSPLVTDTPNTPARRPSTRFTQRLRRASQQTEKTADLRSPEQQQPTQSIPAPAEQPTSPSADRPRGSIEDITALPASYNLQQSPHLRPIDLERPQIPYNFRDHATSQSSFQRPESRPATVRSKRSAFESIPVRRRSSKKRKDGERVREEEIRAMSASSSSVPKRPSESIFRRDSKKRRNVKGSTVSLPYGESIHSMSTVPEQRGWELGMFDMFSPRPAIRLSGTPQYPGIDTYAPPVSQDGSHRAKEKEPMEGFKKSKKTQRIGVTADDMDASDLRLLMERDAKRRERRKREQQEKLDRKLRAKAGRDRADSSKRRREAEETRREQETRARVDEERRARQPLTPPTDVHPAFREEPHLQPHEAVGLGIGQSQQADPTAQQQWKAVEDPFSDSMATPASDVQPQTPQYEGHAAFTPMETPMEDPVVETAQAVRYSQHTPQQSTPPQSPVHHAQQPTPNSSSTNNELRQERTASLPEPPPGMPTVLEERRGSEPKSIESRRAGGWATLFRRGGRKKQGVIKSSGSETSFANTSRESMSRGPIPAHLIGGDRSPFQRNKAGTPTRTQSKFREDLPEMPMSPPDSRMQSPDVPDLPAGAAINTDAYRGRASPRPIDRSIINSRSSEFDTSSATRHDTPVNPGGRGGGLMSASLASVDSEGSWLSGSLKRGSRSSQLSRSIGSLSKRPNEFVASYEDVGGHDKDAEYITRHTPNSDAQKHARRHRRASTPTLTGADEESVLGDSPQGPAAPMTMHGSVRRKPTLVHRDPIARSREGLLAEYATGEVATIEGGNNHDEDLEMVTPAMESQVRRATSVNYHDRGHARRVSAGEPKLLDVPPSRRQSASPTERKRESSQSLSKMAS